MQRTSTTLVLLDFLKLNFRNGSTLGRVSEALCWEAVALKLYSEHTYASPRLWTSH
ncbi:MAG: hypothetical protein UX02_C0002G0023 [Candidatus Moranbacteria bacterium GW2011_GWC1_45_18]|nr:MAG: hypothetical protein UT79_C0001G0438 [Candidatus Moranbacteria bacterium GW2011_GWC2_40_12]KKT32532.1 MAG: hypothetical protein UW19_C0019G0016 [Candidatus Moranbacteria bacterium GW2011_GWF2_44_10]KKT71492.1 MAG: hypothetical protein UW66_C0030G0003 [Candidatus Moranbacteria bacterium GW2011_GWF1_44_4]KKT99704.1 MAG: hypothetical protein UX02_C0002G0023 [Candidatus Moranbacteria bacterium GW2011_GWC1_45_18]